MIQNTLNVEQSRQLLKALADPIRLDVIHALARGNDASVTSPVISTSPSRNPPFTSGCFEKQGY